MNDRKDIRGPRHKVPLDGAKLDQIRKEAALSIVDLAVAAEVSPSTVKRAIRRGKAEVSIFAAEQILFALEEKLETTDLLEQVRFRAKETDQKINAAFSERGNLQGEHFQFTNNEIAARYDDILTVTEVAASSIAAQYDLRLAIDASLLGQAVRATYDELARVGSYHMAQADQSNAYKTGAYTAIWLSRFKPIRIINEDIHAETKDSVAQELAVRVNEIVGINIALAQIGLPQSALENMEAVELIEYVGRRDADPVGLALMLKILHRKAEISGGVLEDDSKTW